jgi:hypothetical protein
MSRKPKLKPLTETERVILGTAAGRRERCALPWPKSVKADAAARDAAVAGLLKRGLLAEAPTAKKSLAWRSDAAGTSVTLTVTDVGLAALEPRVAPEQRPAAKWRIGTTSGSKREAILALLKSEGGTTIADLMAATGWQAHSIRGFLSGTVAKRLGHTVRSVQIEGEARRYRVEA